MRALITGGDSFIGAHLAKALVRRDHTMCALVLYNSLNSLGGGKCPQCVLNFDMRSIIMLG